MYLDTLDIDTIRLATRSSTLHFQELVYVPPAKKPGRTYIVRDKLRAGSNTKLTLSQYIERLFLRNELEALRGKPLTRPQLEHNIFKEFPHLRLDRLKDKRRTLGTYHTSYNRGCLFASQTPPILTSFRYSDEGFIVDPMKPDNYMTFDACKRVAANYRIADPRFFSYPELTEIRKALSNQEEPWIFWNVPTHEETLRLEKTLNKKLYNCLRFPEGLGLQKTVGDL